MKIYHIFDNNIDFPPFKEIFKFNGIPFESNYYLSNYLSSFFELEKVYEIYDSLGIYQVYGNIINF